MPAQKINDAQKPTISKPPYFIKLKILIKAKIIKAKKNKPYGVSNNE